MKKEGKGDGKGNELKPNKPRKILLLVRSWAHVLYDGLIMSRDRQSGWLIHLLYQSVQADYTCCINVVVDLRFHGTRTGADTEV